MSKKYSRAEKLTPFATLQKIYGLTDPGQIKMRIIWNHVQALTVHAYGDSHRKKLKAFDAHFKLCEQVELS